MDPRVIILVNELRPLREHDGIRQINRDRRYRRNKLFVQNIFHNPSFS